MPAVAKPTSLRLSPQASALVEQARRRTNLSRSELIERAILGHMPRLIEAAASPEERRMSLDRLLALGGAGVEAAGRPSAEELAARSSALRD
jgi:Ribbon-helix-helix protein, copG family